MSYIQAQWQQSAQSDQKCISYWKLVGYPWECGFCCNIWEAASSYDDVIIRKCTLEETMENSLLFNDNNPSRLDKCWVRKLAEVVWLSMQILPLATSTQSSNHWNPLRSTDCHAFKVACTREHVSHPYLSTRRPSGAVRLSAWVYDRSEWQIMWSTVMWLGSDDQSKYFDFPNRTFLTGIECKL